MIKEDLSEMHIVISCYMILASERIGLKCLAGIESMDGYIDFGTGGPRKPLILHMFPVAHLIHLLRMGDGKTFPRNHRSDEILARLANELVKADANN
jgi:hypothetical protein